MESWERIDGSGWSICTGRECEWAGITLRPGALKGRPYKTKSRLAGGSMLSSEVWSTDKSVCATEG